MLEDLFRILDKKERGFLDLLVQPEGLEGGNMRIAIEMKNVREVQKRDRDEFERKYEINYGTPRSSLFTPPRAKPL